MLKELFLGGSFNTEPKQGWVSSCGRRGPQSFVWHWPEAAAGRSITVRCPGPRGRWVSETWPDVLQATGLKEAGRTSQKQSLGLAEGPLTGREAALPFLVAGILAGGLCYPTVMRFKMQLQRMLSLGYKSTCAHTPQKQCVHRGACSVKVEQ